jgi:acyl phosphate:glycerol-3-phosphate acyltransferase
VEFKHKPNLSHHVIVQSTRNKNRLRKGWLMPSVLVVLVAYLIGTIPFGYLIVRMSGGGDVRETGSGGTGATNVSRRAGKAAGILTLVLDALKGACAVVLAKVAAGHDVASVTSAGVKWVVAAAAIAVVVGHIFPVWLGFRGGKGVATAVGVFVVLAPFALLCAGIVFVAVVSLTRYVSLASLSAAASVPLFVWLQKLIAQPDADIKAPLTAALVIALLVVFAHRGNITRLINGTEPKFT